MKSASECGVDIVARTNGAPNVDHRKIVQLAFDAANHADCLTEIDLGMTRRMRQWNKDLARPSLLLPHVIGDDRDAAGKPVFVPEPLMDPLRRVPLLLQLAFVVFQDLVDDRNERIELRTGRRLRPTIPRWHRVLQDLRNRLPVDPEHSRRLALAHPLDMARPAYPVVKLHRIHLPALSSFASGSRCGILLRDGQIIRPIPLSILSPRFTRGRVVWPTSIRRMAREISPGMR